MARLRIFIADDHEVVRKGLCALLQAEAGWEIPWRESPRGCWLTSRTAMSRYKGLKSSTAS